jgi:quinol monooxygenase YgiN
MRRKSSIKKLNFSVIQQNKSNKNHKVYFIFIFIKTSWNMQMKNIETNKESPIRVLAFLEAKEGMRQELINVLIPIVEPSRREEGNISYILNSSIENPNEILFDEVWSSKNTFDKHYQHPQSYKNRDKIKDLIVKPMEIKIYSEVSG